MTEPEIAFKLEPAPQEWARVDTESVVFYAITVSRAKAAELCANLLRYLASGEAL